MIVELKIKIKTTYVIYYILQYNVDIRKTFYRSNFVSSVVIFCRPSILD